MGYVDVARNVLKHGASINSLTLREKYTPLHFASEQSDIKVVKLFINRGANIDARTKRNTTPLYLAAKAGCETAVKLLLQHGAKVDNMDKDCKIILYVAVKKGSLSIVEDISKYCPDINNHSNRSSIKIAVHSSTIWLYC